jgi:hypothetical protein
MLGERASASHWIGGWVGPRADLEDVERRKIKSVFMNKLGPD